MKRIINLFEFFFARKIFVTTVHGTYNFSDKFKHFYNSVMVRSKLIIGGSNFIFNHISANYQKYLNPKKKKLMVIFRGINLEYFSVKNTSEKKVRFLATSWKVDKKKFIILGSVHNIYEMNTKELQNVKAFFLSSIFFFSPGE